MNKDNFFQLYPIQSKEQFIRLINERIKVGLFTIYSDASEALTEVVFDIPTSLISTNFITDSKIQDSVSEHFKSQGWNGFGIFGKGFQHPTGLANSHLVRLIRFHSTPTEI